MSNKSKIHTTNRTTMMRDYCKRLPQKTGIRQVKPSDKNVLHHTRNWFYFIRGSQRPGARFSKNHKMITNSS